MCVCLCAHIRGVIRVMSVSKCAMTQTSVRAQRTDSTAETRTHIHTLITSVLHLTYSACSKMLAQLMDGVHVWVCIYVLQQIMAE